MKFTDGVEFDLQGPLRVEERWDGWYLVGGGMLFAVDSREHGEREIQNLTKKEEK